MPVDFQDISWRNLSKKMSLDLEEPETLVYYYEELKTRLKDWKTRFSNDEVNGANLYRCIRIFMDPVNLQQQPEQQPNPEEHVLPVEGGGPEIAEPIPQEQLPLEEIVEENQSARADEHVNPTPVGEPVHIRSFNPRTAVVVQSFVDIIHERTFKTANDYYTGNLPLIRVPLAPSSMQSREGSRRQEEHSRPADQPSSSTQPREDGAGTSGEPPETRCCGDIRLW
ncbi:hypothetical protein LXL04_023717 [Taraxacum kok-saghyz]